ncbi:TonB-dependent receptor [Sinomicrobium weinanense]|uniref:TonB-dependent receptor n=1 Tax=Sinomicrobium weinanense TaxID=2842200 RepID=A0A926JP13_9FLAO|nr:TonB-dependent receptor [Sinomicrobium weinanense]MBC9794673.1 TonB-dependent receptor [Sinomicrobium weinanense]MBU3124158.1 TonB-dependent receptor [Sinomicrobium weinanense]
MKRLFLFIAILGFSVTALAQTGTVRGTVTFANNTPIEYVTITIGQNGTAKGALTNNRGAYEITGVQPGAYLLKASSVGLKTREIRIVVRDNETTTVPNIVLTEQQEMLDEVVVEGHKANKYAKKESVYVSKLPLKDLENPQVFNSIGSELLEDQVVTDFNDALKNAPGISLLWEPTGRGNDGAGYFSIRGFAVQPTMVNGLPALTNGSPDLANTDRIEVIKGPSGTLYGSSLISYGGLINIVTKKPFDTFRGNISYTAGSYGQNRVTVDVNTPLNREKDIFLRVNSAYHTQNSYQDAGFRRSFYIAPSLSYQVNDRLSFNINTEIYNGRATNQTMLFLDRGNPLKVHNIDELNYDHKRSYTSNDLYIDNPTFSLQAQMNYKINDQWTSQTSFSSSSTKSSGYYSYLYESTTRAEDDASTTLDDGIVLTRYLSKQNSETVGTDIQQNFIGDFKIGSLRNRLVVGLDYLKTDVSDNSSPYTTNGLVYIGTDIETFNRDILGIDDPENFTDDTGVLTQAGTDALLANSQINPSRTVQEVFSAYASDVINILPELSAMASLRVDRFWNDTFNQTTFSPKFGLVYQPVLDKVSVFANYMDGFTNLAPQTEVTNGNRTMRSFKPEHANQFEVGTKLNLFNDKFTASLSYYDIKVTDKTLRNDIDGINYYYTQDGEQRSKGFETTINANPVPGLNLIAGYSYNDSKLEEGAVDFKGRRPEEAGPVNMANFWAGYQFTGGKLEGFGVGFGGNYSGENKIMNRNLSGTFTLPEYTILNASVYYGIKDFRITLKINNITDEEYYKGWSTLNPQWTRTVSANFSYTF